MEEKRESVLVPDVPADQAAWGGRNSEQRTPDLSADELTLNKAEITSLRKNPLLLVQEPTPDVVEVKETELEE